MSRKTFASAVEALETRTLFASIGVNEVAVADGTQLRISGTIGNDSITVRQTEGGLLVRSAGYSKTFDGDYVGILVNAGKGNDCVKLDETVSVDAVLNGAGGADKLVGGAGDDKLFAGGGVDTLVGGKGNDVLVSIGNSTVDRNTGGSGRDSFWADDSAREKITDATVKEIVLGAVHRVDEFFSYRTRVNGTFSTTAVAKSLSGQELVDPTLTSTSLTYKDFRHRPLFSAAGPSPDDISQGWLGDCYYLATLSSIADVNPDRIRQSVVDLGDGTYAVQFFQNNQPVYVRVDGDLPTWSWGDLAYADYGAGNSIWVAVMEKAYAFFRYNEGSYASLEGGWMSSVYTALGCSGVETIWNAADGGTLLEQIDEQLDEGDSVTFAVYTAPSGAPVVGSHAYSVDRVIRDADGNAVKLVLRNPWGVDGRGSDGADDGYVTLTASQALGAFWGVISACA